MKKFLLLCLVSTLMVLRSNGQIANFTQVKVPELRGAQYLPTLSCFLEIENSPGLYHHNRIYKYDELSQKWDLTNIHIPLRFPSPTSIGNTILWYGQDLRDRGRLLTLYKNSSGGYDTIHIFSSTFAVKTPKVAYMGSWDSIFVTRDLINKSFVGKVKYFSIGYEPEFSNDSCVGSLNFNKDSILIAKPTGLFYTPLGNYKKFLNYEKGLLNETTLNIKRRSFPNQMDSILTFSLLGDTIWAFPVPKKSELIQLGKSLFVIVPSPNGLNEEIFVSKNEGRSWHLTNSESYINRFSKSCQLFGGRVMGDYYYSRDPLKGLNRTRDFVNWESLNENFYARGVRFLNKKLWIQNDSGTIFNSIDSGTTWNRINYKFKENYVPRGLFGHGRNSSIGKNFFFYGLSNDTGKASFTYMLKNDSLIRGAFRVNNWFEYPIGNRLLRLKSGAIGYEYSVDSGQTWQVTPNGPNKILLPNGDIFIEGYSFDSSTYFNLSEGKAYRFFDVNLSNKPTYYFRGSGGYSSSDLIITQPNTPNAALNKITKLGLVRIPSAGLILNPTPEVYYVSENELAWLDTSGIKYSSDTGWNWQTLATSRDLKHIGSDHIWDITVINQRLYINTFHGLYTSAILRSGKKNALASFEFYPYPNPSKEFVMVEGIKKSTPYCLINTMGQVCEQGTVDSGGMISVKNLCSGIYFLKIAGVGSQRIVKE